MADGEVESRTYLVGSLGNHVNDIMLVHLDLPATMAGTCRLFSPQAGGAGFHHPVGANMVKSCYEWNVECTCPALLHEDCV